MSYDSFCASRDIFYAACMIAGSAAGLFAGAFRQSKTPREKSRDITTALYITSASIVCAGGALCISEYIIFYPGALVLGGVFAALFFSAFFFPATMRFALCSLLSLLILSALYFYTVGSAFNGGSVPIARVTFNGSDMVTVKGAYNQIPVFTAPSPTETGVRVFYDKRYTGALKYAVSYIEAGRIMPLFGGLKRVILLSITVEQTESGRAFLVFSAKPMEETLLGRLLGSRAEALTSASEKAFRPDSGGFAAMQIIYGRAKIPAAGASGGGALTLQNRHGIWREEWARE